MRKFRQQAWDERPLARVQMPRDAVLLKIGFGRLTNGRRKIELPLMRGQTVSVSQSSGAMQSTTDLAGSLGEGAS
jgi:hypothetical protein